MPEPPARAAALRPCRQAACSAACPRCRSRPAGRRSSCRRPTATTGGAAGRVPAPPATRRCQCPRCLRPRPPVLPPGCRRCCRQRSAGATAGRTAATAAPAVRVPPVLEPRAARPPVPGHWGAGDEQATVRPTAGTSARAIRLPQARHGFSSNELLGRQGHDPVPEPCDGVLVRDAGLRRGACGSAPRRSTLASDRPR